MSNLEKILALPKVTHNLVQGSPEWDQFRLEHRGASEAAAALGLSKSMRRNELLHMKHTGHAREFSEWLQTNVLDKGHVVEAQARPILEGIIGDDLYPVTCSRGLISASCDGLTMDDVIAMEHKQWNETLAASVEAGILPEEHWPQCQQVLLVTGAQKLYFVVSDGTPKKFVFMVVEPDPEKWEALADGWAQFEVDRATYVVPDARAPTPVAEKKASLPALVVDVRGEVVDSNLEQWRIAAIEHIGQISTTLVSDQDFADADEAVKWCESSKVRLQEVKAAALARMATVDQLFSVIDEIVGTMDTKRKSLTRLIETRKEARKKEIVDVGVKALNEHIAAQERSLVELLPEGTVVKGCLMPVTDSDFWGVIKGKRSYAVMENAVSDEVARCKVVANRAFELRKRNILVLQDKAKDHKHLFADWRDLIGKDGEFVDLTVAQRIQAEVDRIAEEARKKREAEAEAEAAALRKSQEATQLAAQDQFECGTGVTVTSMPAGGAAPVVQHVPFAALHAAAPEVVPFRGGGHVSRPPVPSGPPTLSLGEIKKLVHPFDIGEAGLRELGFEPAARAGAARMYHHADLPRMLQAGIDRLTRVRADALKVAAVA